MPRVRTELRRKAILEAAAAAFAARGYHQTTVAEVAASMQMGLGTFYRYFENKLDVFHAVIEGVLNQMVRVVLAEVPTDSQTLPAYRKQVERIGLSLFRAFG